MFQQIPTWAWVVQPGAPTCTMCSERPLGQPRYPGAMTHRDMLIEVFLCQWIAANMPKANISHTNNRKQPLMFMNVSVGWFQHLSNKG